MGIYSRLIFPRLCDWAMRSPSMTRLRSEVLSEVDGEILEIGFGTGLNLGHYPEHVRHLTAVDPGVGMTRIARRRIERSHIDVDLRVQTAEELPFEDGRFDCVVSTWTLCSIRDSDERSARLVGCSDQEGSTSSWSTGWAKTPESSRWQRRLTPAPAATGRWVPPGCGY